MFWSKSILFKVRVGPSWDNANNSAKKQKNQRRWIDMARSLIQIMKVGYFSGPRDMILGDKEFHFLPIDPRERYSVAKSRAASSLKTSEDPQARIGN